MKRHLFVLHVWAEALDQQQSEWRGRITYLDSGEIRFFRDPASLHQTLLHMLPDEKGIDKTIKGNPDRLDGTDV